MPPFCPNYDVFSKKRSSPKFRWAPFELIGPLMGPPKSMGPGVIVPPCPPLSVALDRRIDCDVDNYHQEHIFCSCSPALKVSIKDRAYLRDQRLKKGPKGLLQMASADRVTVKRALRSSASFPRSTVDSSCFPCTSIQSSTDTESASVHSEVSFNKQYVAVTASDTTIMQSH